MRFAVVGHPLDHSKSPAMFRAAFDALDLPHSYSTEDVLPKDLPALIEKVRTGEYSGLSITVPYKEEVIRYLDDLSDDARAIKAVNTVYMRNGKVTGDNTDWIGFKKALFESIDIKGKKILVCGAGGAARACLYALRDHTGYIFLSNRNKEKGFALAQEFGATFVPRDALPQVHILINATSSGLTGDLPLPEEYLGTVKFVFDLMYGESPLMLFSRRSGLAAIDGSGMLLYQGAEQFKIFTGVQAPIEAMKAMLPR